MSLYALQPILFDEIAAHEYLLSVRVFYEKLKCPSCGSEMRREGEQWFFRCLKSNCRAKRSLSSHSFFSGSRLKAHQILMLARLWISKVNIHSAISLSGHSPNTVVAFWRHFRQLVSSTIELEDTTIGGNGVIVEVDETKLGKRKYNRGHRVEGVWVIVGIERTPARKVFVAPVEQRDAATIQQVILRHILPGSMVYTDLWRGYTWLDNDMDFAHGTVNHSVSFKDHETGIHTNTVEGTNSALKRVIPVRSRVKNGMEDHLGEFVWRRKHESDDLWERFIAAIRDIHYDLD